MVAKTTLRDHNGPCGAVLSWGTPCSCFGFEYYRTVAGYRDCVCGHSQGIHALGVPVPDLTEHVITKVCPTCGQVIPEEPVEVQALPVPDPSHPYQGEA